MRTDGRVAAASACRARPDRRRDGGAAGAAAHAPAISLLVEAGRAFPEAFDFLNRSGLILDAALLVKLVNRYDRPALARRLWRRGWLDVHGTPEQWKPFGIDAQPTVPFPQPRGGLSPLPGASQRRQLRARRLGQ